MDSNSFMSARSARLIAGARALMAVFLCASVPLDPNGQAVRDPAPLILFGYASYAVLLFIAVRSVRLRDRLQRAALAFAAFDAAVFACLLYVTGGADSPLFSPLVFLILSATLLWGSQGALIMGVLASLIFLPTGFFAFSDPERPLAGVQLVVRGGYLAIVALLLWAFARHTETVVEELSRLSNPINEVEDDTNPPLADSLSYAMDVFESPAGAIVWEDPEEPGATLLVKRQGQPPAIVSTTLDPEELEKAIPTQQALLVSADGRSLVRTGGRVRPGPAVSIPEALTDALPFEQALFIHAATESGRAWLVLCDHHELANEDLAVAASVAANVSLSLQRWRAMLDRKEIAAAEERLRLARDLHDGVLQFMAGTGLQLDAILRGQDLPQRDRERLEMLKRLLVDEQRELRTLITNLRPRGDRSLARLHVRDEIDELVERLRRSWSVDIEAQVSPIHLRVPPSFCFDLTRLIREGVANAVRHGRAKTVRVAVVADAGTLRLSIADDGLGLEQQGSWTDAQMSEQQLGPRSLRERTRMLGGHLQMESSRSGLRLSMALPLKELA